ncbi:MAG: protoporphyrinogen oxidase [Elusimicrobia bacterium]|nr:protoporphyrinogen oxidase [Elusimicrobiota bacterium]MDE2237381.1 protoporphyrinogen oxidase [Elusimicrobiota bacterium]MDE2425407.1 protoporphyrinogen oxidase [Elusimicrobiota bacterium]
MGGRAAPRVAVLGGGITGLTAAYELLRLSARQGRALELTLLEGSGRLGGKIHTEVREGAVIEAGPDSFITLKPHALELVRELGLAGELVKTSSGPNTIWVCSGGRLRAMPDGMGMLPTRLVPFVLSDLMSWRGKLRMLGEPLVPVSAGHEDESLAAFVRRRLGAEALETVLGPMLAGIYAGDAEQMSLRSTFPQLKEMERRGGLLRSLWSSSGKAKPAAQDTTLFMTLRGGLESLVEALAKRLPPGCARTGLPAQGLRRRAERWVVSTSAGALEFDGVISALPANQLAKVVADQDLELSCVLGEIPFASTATVSTLFDKKGFPHPLNGFGFLVPRGERRSVAAATFSSTKFPSRAGEDSVLIRSFLGGVGREAYAEMDDDTGIARAARQDLRELLGLGELHPRLTRTFRFTKANPQYTVGHEYRIKRLSSCLRGHPGLALAGCSYNGVGVPDCVRSGRQAAERLLKFLSSGAPAGVC